MVCTCVCVYTFPIKIEYIYMHIFQRLLYIVSERKSEAVNKQLYYHNWFCIYVPYTGWA